MNNLYAYSKNYKWLFEFFKEFRSLSSLDFKVANIMMNIYCRNDSSPYMLFDMTDIPCFYDSHPGFASCNKNKMNRDIRMCGLDLEDFGAMINLHFASISLNSQELLDDCGWNAEIDKNDDDYETIESYRKEYYDNIEKFRKQFLNICEATGFEYIKPKISLIYLRNMTEKRLVELKK